MQQRPSLGIIGAGKVGNVLARLFYGAGYEIRAIYSRTPFNAESLATQVQARAVLSPYEVSIDADLTMLTVPDDAIAEFVKALAQGDWTGKGVVHTSGAHDANILALLAERGAMTGSLHPAFPFADVEAAVMGLPGAAFAVEAEPEKLKAWLRDMVLALNGRVLMIPPGGKATYHAALVFVSNYTVTLYALAESLLTGLGAEREAADQALNVLLGATVENLRLKGVPDALTGPLVRGDVGTLAAHVEALKDAQLVDVYRQLARLSLPMLTARGIATGAVEHLLEQDKKHATHDS